jgi:hypothetical protein
MIDTRSQVDQPGALTVSTEAVANLPIVPLLLLPFALIFFIIVFPFWGVALGVLGLLLVILRGLNSVFGKGHGPFAGPAAAVYRAFRWVLTFGGFVRLGESAPPANQPHS